MFSFFPELSDLRSPEKDRILLSHALTMSMGLKWVEATPSTGNYDNDESRMHMARDPCRYVLGLPMVAPAGQDFSTTPARSRWFSAIVRKAVGKPLDEFAREALFEPLGITRFEWTRVKGRYRCRRRIAPASTRHGQDRSARPRGRALERSSDRVEGVDRRFDETARWRPRVPISTVICGGSAAPSTADVRSIGTPRSAARGQSIRVVPELDVVVAVTAGYYQDYSPRAFQLQSGLFKDVLRAIPATG
ncbi:serine hydrolase [Bradyrhizobium betae]